MNLWSVLGAMVVGLVKVVTSSTPQPWTQLHQDMTVLEAFYQATSGARWAGSHIETIPSSWLSDADSHIPKNMVTRNKNPWLFERNSSTGEYLHSPCAEAWYGIACDITGASITQLAVTLIGPGTLPPELFKGLPHLQILYIYCLLSDTDLPGQCKSGPPPTVPRCILPPTFGQSWPEMQLLLLMWVYPGANIAQLPGIRVMSKLQHIIFNGYFFTDLGAFLEQTSAVHMPGLKTIDMGTNMIEGGWGTFPTSIGRLTNIVMLNFWDTKLAGHLPKELGLLTRLRVLDLGSNRISGSIPSSLGELTNMQYFNLGTNRMDGPFPSFLTSMVRLEGLDLHNNYLGSSLSYQDAQRHLHDCPLNFLTLATIPDSISRLTSLKILGLDSNYLQGALPSALGRLAQIEYFYGHDNCFTSSLPPELFALSTLRAIYLGNNTLVASLPPVNPDKMGNLSILSLSSNRITGTISPILGSLTGLKELDLSSNRLHGRVPWELSRLHSLSSLNLGNNHLSNTLPSALSRLSRLETLIVANNSLWDDTGAFSFINTTSQRSLRLVDITRNKFTGTLPFRLFSLPQLTFFFASSNCFHGRLDGEAMCRATRLQKLVLDGLASGSNCLVPYFPNFRPASDDGGGGGGGDDDGGNDADREAGQLHFFFNGVHSKKLMSGTIPPCLFDLPRLQTLHLSGNGFSGVIPQNINISQRLSKLFLAHNRLSNSIPPALLRSLDQFSVLDLSFNQLKGDLGKSKVDPASSLVLRVNCNRLSGDMPEALSRLSQRASLNVLDGNIFSCPASPLQSSLLPDTDPYSIHYQCGSMTMDRYFATFFGLCGLLLVAYVALARRRLAGKGVSPATSPSPSSPRASDEAVGLLPFLEALLDTAPIAASLARLTHRFSPPPAPDATPSSSGGPVVARASTRAQLTSPVVARFLAALDDLKLYAAAVLLFMVFLLTPLYGALSVYQSDLGHSYSYAVTAAFKHGLPATSVLFIVWWSVVLGNAYIFTGIFGHTEKLQQSEVERAYTSLVQQNLQSLRRRATVSFRALQLSYLQHRAASVDSSAYRCRHLRLALRLAVIASANVFVSLLVNISFVYLVNLRDASKSEQVVLKLCLAGYKVLSNHTIIPWTLSLRLLQMGLPRKTIDEAGLLRGGEVFTVLLVTFNYIVAPCVALSLADSTCFKNVIDAPPGVSSSYHVQSIILYTYFKVFTTEGTDTSLGAPKADQEANWVWSHNSYKPMFIYQYQCTSTVIVLFAPVFMLSCIISAFGPILKNWLWRKLLDWATSRLNGGKVIPSCVTGTGADTGTSTATGTADAGTGAPAVVDSIPEPRSPLLQSPLLARLRRLLLRTTPKGYLTSHERRERDRDKVLSVLGRADVGTFEEVHASMLDARQFFQQILLDSVLLVTFGTACPLLGITVCVCVAFRVARWRRLLSGLLRQVGADAEDGGAGEAVAEAGHASYNLAEELTLLEGDILAASGSDKNTHPLYNSRWLVLLLSTCFYAPFLVDVSSNAWVALAFVLACLLPFALRKLLYHRREGALGDDRRSTITIKDAKIVDNPLVKGRSFAAEGASGELELSTL